MNNVYSLPFTSLPLLIPSPPFLFVSSSPSFPSSPLPSCAQKDPPSLTHSREEHVIQEQSYGDDKENQLSWFSTVVQPFLDRPHGACLLNPPRCWREREKSYHLSGIIAGIIIIVIISAGVIIIIFIIIAFALYIIFVTMMIYMYCNFHQNYYNWVMK